MGDKTKEVGGGPATGLADNFIAFLQKGLQSGSFGSGSGGKPQSNRPNGGFNPNVPNAGGGAQTTGDDALNRSDPFGSTEGIGGVLDKFLGGDFGSQKYGVDTTGLKNNTGGFDFSKFQLPGSVDLSGFNTNALKNFNSNITPGSNNAPGVADNAGFQSLLSTLMKSTTGGGPAGAQPGQVSINKGPVDFSAFIPKMEMDKARDQADLRARFGASGGASFGTPAAVAEGNFLASRDAENLTALGNIGQKQQELNVQAQIGAGQINAQNYGSWLDSVTRTDSSNKSALSSGLNTLANAIGTDAQNFVNMRGQDLDAQIKSKGLSLDAIAKATGLDLDVLNAGIAQNKNIAQMLNERAQIESGNQVQNRGLDIEALSKALGFDLEGQGLNESARKTNLGAQGDMLRSLLEMFSQLSGKGIAQRQTVTTPGVGSTIGGILKGGAGLAGSLFGAGNPFGSTTKSPYGGGTSTNDPYSGNWYNEGGPVHDGKGDEDDTDSLVARLTPGEFVINKHATKVLGEDFLAKLNAVTHKPPKAPKDGKAKSPTMTMPFSMVGHDKGGFVMPDSGPHPDVFSAFLAGMNR